TGRPTPSSPAYIRATAPSLSCQSGQACPRTGYWIAAGYIVVRRFEKGEILPTLNVRNRQSRFLFPDRITVETEKVDWILHG
ncbi:MAG: sel1 repeat family protein, partial [Pseudomonas sp.]